MKRLSLITAMALVALLVGACGPTEAPAPAPTPEPQSAQPVTPPQEEPAVEPPAEAPAEGSEPTEAPTEPTAATPSSSASLVGTSWEVGEFTLAFKPNSVVKVSGGAAADGIEAQYTVKEGGNFEIIAPDGNTYPGTFDGTALKVTGPDGIAVDGKRVEPQTSDAASTDTPAGGEQAAAEGGALNNLDDFDFAPGGGSASKRR